MGYDDDYPQTNPHDVAIQTIKWKALAIVGIWLGVGLVGISCGVAVASGGPGECFIAVGVSALCAMLATWSMFKYGLIHLVGPG